MAPEADRGPAESLTLKSSCSPVGHKNLLNALEVSKSECCLLKTPKRDEETDCQGYRETVLKPNAIEKEPRNQPQLQRACVELHREANSIGLNRMVNLYCLNISSDADLLV